MYEDRLDRYEALVRSYAPRLDLIAPSDLDRFRSRHIDDSLRLVALVDEVGPGPCMDLGSGAGLPGIPLAIARPQRHWRLVEPRRRRAGFLEEVVRDLSLDCEVIVAPAEELVGDPRYRDHALACARALAPPADALELLRAFVRPGGVAAVFVGSGGQVPPQAEEWEEGIAIVRG